MWFLGIRAIEWKTNTESFADMADKDDDKGIRVYLQSQHGEVKFEVPARKGETRTQQYLLVPFFRNSFFPLSSCDTKSRFCWLFDMMWSILLGVLALKNIWNWRLWMAVEEFQPDREWLLKLILATKSVTYVKGHKNGPESFVFISVSFRFGWPWAFWKMWMTT